MTMNPIGAYIRDAICKQTLALGLAIPPYDWLPRALDVVDQVLEALIESYRGLQEAWSRARAPNC
jgi:hypothetical protein